MKIEYAKPDVICRLCEQSIDDLEAHVRMFHREELHILELHDMDEQFPYAVF